MIKVSVIVPVYKVPLEYLRACLDSLNAQTMQECEFIIVSDGAPDAECAICAEYAGKDSRLKFFRREHAGVSATRNYGIEKAQGEYITFVDADDVILENAIEFWYKKAKEWNSDILMTPYKEIDENSGTHPWQQESKPRINNSEMALIIQELIHPRQNSIPRGVWGKTYRHEFLISNNIFFNTFLTIGEDFIFNLHCFNKTKEISFIPDTLYSYRITPNSATRAFNPNFFHDHIAPILEVKKIYPNKYEDLLGREALDILFLSWPLCYMNPQNTESLNNRMTELKRIVNSSLFQGLIANATTKNTNILFKLERFLFKKKIIFPIWLHAIKELFFRKKDPQ